MVARPRTSGLAKSRMLLQAVVNIPALCIPLRAQMRTLLERLLPLPTAARTLTLRVLGLPLKLPALEQTRLSPVSEALHGLQPAHTGRCAFLPDLDD